MTSSICALIMFVVPVAFLAMLFDTNFIKHAKVSLYAASFMAALWTRAVVTYHTENFTQLNSFLITVMVAHYIAASTLLLLAVALPQNDMTPPVERFDVPNSNRPKFC